MTKIDRRQNPWNVKHTRAGRCPGPCPGATDDRRRVFVWPASAGRVADARCPDCNEPLRPTSIATARPDRIRVEFRVPTFDERAGLRSMGRPKCVVCGLRPPCDCEADAPRELATEDPQRDRGTRGPGRPPGPGGVRTARIELRTTEDDKLTFQTAAAAAGMNLTKWLLDAGRQSARRQGRASE